MPPENVSILKSLPQMLEFLSWNSGMASVVSVV